MRKLFLLVLSLAVMLAVAAPVAGAESALSPDIVILYTNDVHTYIDGPISYDVIAGVRNELEKQYEHVLLVDAGDHAQGTAYGSMDKGETVIRLMNAAGYDAQQDRSLVEPVEVTVEFGNMYTKEIEAFADALLNGTEPPVNGRNTLLNQRVIEAVYRTNGGKL